MESSGPASLFAEILAPSLVARELRQPGDPATLLPEELEIVATAVPGRRREFSAGRTCARAALTSLGVEAVPILSGAKREPIWPPGVVGSITHCVGFAGAVVGRAQEWVGVGIDVEPAARLPREVVPQVMGRGELGALERLPDSDVPWDLLVFSAKESVYKLWYPQQRRWLGFKDVRVRLSDDGSFSARIARTDRGSLPSDLVGRWAVGDGLAVTAVALRR